MTIKFEEEAMDSEVGFESVERLPTEARLKKAVSV